MTAPEHKQENTEGKGLGLPYSALEKGAPFPATTCVGPHAKNRRFQGPVAKVRLVSA